MSKGNSFSNGSNPMNGQSTYNGPYNNELQQGWDCRPYTIWDHLEGRFFI